MKNYLLELDSNQQKAVCHTKGPIIILAGAGSGKTRVITYRIVNLIHQGIPPHNILALTFTNKAANEMRERIANKIGSSSKLWMGTFHSIFAKLLRFNASAIGYTSNFSIYDTLDSKSLLKQIIKELNLDDNTYNNARILNRISWAKNNLINANQYSQREDILTHDRKSNRPSLGKIYQEYENRSLASNAMDFDDLLFKFYHLISSNKDILDNYQETFKYILVDEYQDTNHLQYKIINLLASKYRNICVVGDDSQSIYSFRGATVKNILNFQVDYPDAEVCKLEQNYRSTKTIVDTANKIIKYNTNRLEKNVFSENEPGSKIELHYLKNESEEAMYVANDIFNSHTLKNMPYDQFSILYRTNAQSRPIEEALRKIGIPYNIYGGLSFYSRKEIKDTVAYLRLAINPNDEEAFKRVINYPKRGIGQTTVDKILSIVYANKEPLFNVLTDIDKYISGKQIESIKIFVELINTFTDLAKTNNAYQMVNQIITDAGISLDLYNDKTVEGLNKFNNLQEILNAAKQFVSEVDDPEDAKLTNFLQEIALYNNNDDVNKENAQGAKVSLMTVHSAKGLEFLNVYIVGVENGLFPSQMSVAESNLEEERRLFYVAITRAKKRLVVTNVKQRYKYGLLKECETSIFIDELKACGGDNISIRDSNKYISDKKNSVNIYSKQEKVAAVKQTKPNINTFDTKHNLVPLTANTINRSINSDAGQLLLDKIKVGTKVKHSKFGVGQVIDIVYNNANSAVTVDFGKSGTKQLLVHYAKLEILLY
ncbi:MAG: ATP-dependent helicase [Solitalea-like symbiont of Tyrophagus putrescentiae]